MLRSVGSFKEARWRSILLQGGRCVKGAQNTQDSLFNVVVEAGGHDFHPAVEAKLFILILLFLKLPVLFLGPECYDILRAGFMPA